MTTSNDTIGKAVKDFLAEAEEIIDQLSLDLVGLSDSADSGECNPDLLNSIFRGAHSLKGLAGMFGFTGIAELAHNLENLLDSLRLGRVSLAPPTLNVLFDSMDILGALVRSAGTGSSDTNDLSRAIARINSCLTSPQKAESESPLAHLALPDKVLNTLTEYEEHRLLENVKKGRRIYSILASFSLTTFDQELGELTDVLKKGGEVISTLPSVGGNLESTIDFEILFGSERGSAEISALVGMENVTVSLLGGGAQAPALAAPVAPSAPSLPDAIAPAPSPADDSSLTAKSMSRTVRVDIGKLDELMNIVGELVLSHSKISDLTFRMRDEGLSTHAMEMGKAAKGLGRKLDELQKGVMEIRMIPVGQLYEKMSRIVRKISREQGKKVELKMFGADTELDKLIVEDISDPMMHIVRNAIDHGIEPSEERLRLGKDEKGTIRLSSFQKGNHVVIEVEDDGRGIDLERVKKKALEKGFIQSLESISDRDALELVFLPGFSTSEKVSEISGRGVGMDVVKNNIAAVSGMVDIETTAGCGCRMIITLPITLAIIKALIIASVGRTYALPITSVLETIMVDCKDILTVERKEVIQLRETTLPLLRLGKYFEIGEGSNAQESFYVVVVGAAEKRLGIVVDDLLGQQDIVIKSMGETLKGCKGISGAADLGDQRTILVLDVGGIINEATRGSA
ncbi:MAG: two-component system chemotaxis family sensor kinase [Geobacteraceae bacterium]|nr:MAG: two-component system chemotaxis family sensor kinase [Geobacteraceae bacterium]